MTGLQENRSSTPISALSPKEVTVSKRDVETLDQQGHFTIYKVEMIDDQTGATSAIRYEVRKSAEVIGEFDTETEAIKEMELQQRLARQNRASGPGM